MHGIKFARAAILAALCLGLSGCFSFTRHGELPTAPFVAVDRVMGTWYVQGAMTTLLDRHPHAASFNFTRQRDGSIDVEYTFRPGSLMAEPKTYTAKAFIDEIESYADWSIQFLWPFENDLRVIYVSDDYSTMIMGHPSRKYLYIMSRDRSLDTVTMEWLLDFAASRGFDTSYLRRIPHQ